MNSRTYIRSFQKLIFEENLIIKFFGKIKSLISLENRIYGIPNGYKSNNLINNKECSTANKLFEKDTNSSINFLE